LAYETVPGAVGRVFGTQVRINSAGFRDREYPLEKPEGTRRLLVLGDSITFGNSLRREERFSEILEERYREDGEPVEVLNLGVAGYDTVQEIAFLERSGLAFDPDVVLVAYCVNDMGIHTTSLRALRMLESNGRWFRASRLVQVVFVNVDTKLFTRGTERANFDPEFRRVHGDRIAKIPPGAPVRELMSRLRDVLDSDPPKPPVRFLSWHTSPAKVGRFRWAMERLRELGSAHGFRAAVAIIPYLDERGKPEAFRQAYAVVEHEVRRAGHRAILLREDLVKLGLERARHPATPDEPVNLLHPGPAGHRAIAEALHRTLEW
ncbi:MAG TPA: GDSL-type esterase/lipase family protein, partial [bacterium]|nr:GDSL-type esterase/lipase family protein [bacterium]